MGSFPQLLPSQPVGQVYQDPRAFPPGLVQGWISWLSPTSTLQECGHTVEVRGVSGLSLQGLPFLDAHWAALSHPYLTFNPPSGPSAVTVGKLISVPGCPWAGLRGSPLPLGFNPPWTDRLLWLGPGHLLLAHVAGSQWPVGAAPWFPLAVPCPRHACSTSVGLPAGRGSIRLLLGAGSASGSVSCIQMHPLVPLASKLVLSAWPLGPAPLGNGPSSHGVPAAWFTAQPRGLQC